MHCSERLARPCERALACLVIKTFAFALHLSQHAFTVALLETWVSPGSPTMLNFYVSQGDELYADGLIVEASGLTTNEAALTGESDDVKKNATAKPFVYSGTQVMDGVGKYVRAMLVVRWRLRGLRACGPRK